MNIALLIAGGLIFYLRIVCGAFLHHRRAYLEGHEDGYLDAMCDMADAEALAESLADPEAVHIAMQRLAAQEGLQ